MIETASILGTILIALDLQNIPRIAQKGLKLESPVVLDVLPKRELFKRVISDFSEKEGIDGEHLIKVAQCESNFNEKALGDNGKAYSIFQFWKETFKTFKQEAEMLWLQYEDPIDQIRLAVWAFSNGKESHWTCHKRVMEK